jgi:hypothetical protein
MPLSSLVFWMVLIGRLRVIKVIPIVRTAFWWSKKMCQESGQLPTK